METVFTYFVHNSAESWLGFDDVRPSEGIDVPWWVCEDPPRMTLMLEITAVGLNRAKNLCQVQEADAMGSAVLRKKMRRNRVLVSFSR